MAAKKNRRPDTGGSPPDPPSGPLRKWTANETGSVSPPFPPPTPPRQDRRRGARE